MASQGFGPLAPGQAPYSAQPDTPRGLYREFGMPDTLLRIHFPKDPNKNPNTSTPWFWFFERQQPQAFSFLAPGVWGRGWERLPDFGIIKILPIDTQQLVPLPQVGGTSLEDAVRRLPPDKAWGRFDFTDQRIWDLVGKSKPKFNVDKGLLKARDSKTNINNLVKTLVNTFRDDWNDLANNYNKIANGVNPTTGFHYPGQKSAYKFPLPAGPPTTVGKFQQQLQAFEKGPPYLQGAAFIGPVPATAFFQIPTFDVDAYAFTLTIGQLDPKKWNMSVFPPLEVSTIGNGSSSAKSGNYSGVGQTAFPFAGPQT